MGDQRIDGLGVVAFTALGRAMFRWRVLVLLLWAVITVLGAVVGGQIFDRASSVDSLSSEAESARTQQMLDARLGDGPEVFAIAAGRHPRDPVLIESLVEVAGGLRAVDGVVEVHDGYTAPGGLIGADDDSVMVRVEMRLGLSAEEQQRVEAEVAALLRTIDAPEVLVGGEKLAERAFAEQAIRDATVGESIALVVLFIALLVIFGGAVAASLPLLVALGAITATLLGLVALTAVTPVSEFAVNVVTLLGIGLAVDYTLVLVFRFREERAANPQAGPAEWMGRTMATAGYAVLISGLAVTAAMFGLSVFAEQLLASIAQGGAIVAVVVTAAALTAVPALVGVAHRRIPATGAPTWVNRSVGRIRNRLGRTDRSVSTGVLARLAGFAYRRPAPVIAAVGGGLLIVALPAAALNLGNSDARSLPVSMEARQAYDTAQSDFFANRAAPVVVVAAADPAEPAVRDLLNELLVLPEVFQVQVRFDLPPGITVIDHTPHGGTGGPESQDLVREVRDMSTAAMPLMVGGVAAEVVDHADSLGSRVPIVIGVLLAASMMLLFVLTGSVVIPIKALVINGLTLLATLGVLVVVFQWGVGSSLLGFESWGALDLTTPVFLLVFIYALTMDYEVFLLSRIKEEYDRGAGSRAIVQGITASGQVVTAAAVCIIIVFLGFVLGELVAVKEVGFGMAVAIALDVTLMRGLLLPAVMSVLGERNWWAPAPLRRWHARWLNGSVRPERTGEKQHQQMA